MHLLFKAKNGSARNIYIQIYNVNLSICLRNALKCLFPIFPSMLARYAGATLLCIHPTGALRKAAGPHLAKTATESPS